MKRLPWWFRKPADDEDEPRTLGEPGEGKRLIVTRRDDQGYVIERTWVDEDAASHYDERIWRDDDGPSWSIPM